MTFDELFPEYFTLYRGQATNIPGATDPEYLTALKLASASVRKWDRADGVEWTVLWKNFKDNSPQTTISSGVTSYPVTDMRKPPKQVLVGSQEFAVIKPSQVDLVNSNCAWFTGSPSTGWNLHFKTVTDEMVGLLVDFVYLKKPNEIVDGTSVIEMSDPTFMIHDMLAARFTQSRNGFAVKVHKQEANIALQNMKIEDMSGTYGNSDRLGSDGAGWGVTHNARTI